MTAGDNINGIFAVEQQFETIILQKVVFRHKKLDLAMVLGYK